MKSRHTASAFHYVNRWVDANALGVLMLVVQLLQVPPALSRGLLVKAIWGSMLMWMAPKTKHFPGGMWWPANLLMSEATTGYGWNGMPTRLQSEGNLRKSRTNFLVVLVLIVSTHHV